MNESSKEKDGSSNRNDGDIITLDGYTKIFGECENQSDIHHYLVSRIGGLNIGTWRNWLEDKKKYKPVEEFFSYWDDHCDSEQLTHSDELIKFIELFSLAENVLRNAVLRPYIPAYRIINTNCGRYSFSATQRGEKVFRLFNFHKTSENRITYQETNPLYTVLYALTCCVFWKDLTMRLKPKPKS